MKVGRYTKLWEWQQRAKLGGICLICQKESVLTVDHIIPDNFLQQVGLFDERCNWEDNFQLVCKTCQTYKGGRIDIKNPKSLSLLKEIIKKLEILSKAGVRQE